MKATKIGAALSLAVVLASTHARADGSAEAEELFKQGRAALEAKDYVTACKKLAESNRLERAVGTLISLATCNEAQGKLASARANWQEAADFADATNDRLQRGPGARQKFEELDKRVPRLTIVRSAKAPASTSAKRDDVVLGAGSFDTPLPIDPGKHVIVASADGFAPRSFEVTLAEGEKKTLEIEPGAAVAPPNPTQDRKPDQPAAENDGSSMRIAGYVVGGVGVVGLAVGTIFGLRASSKWDDAQKACVPGKCGAGSDAQNDKDAAATSGNVSTVTFLLGGAALATGIVLVVLAPSSRSSTSARVAPSPGGLSLVGSF